MPWLTFGSSCGLIVQLAKSCASGLVRFLVSGVVSGRANLSACVVVVRGAWQ